MRFAHHPSSRTVPLTLALALLLALATLVAACDAGSARAQLTGKPTGYGTPVNGAYQPASAHPNGHYESLIADGATLYAGSDNGNVYAFDSASGALRWHHDTGDNALVYGIAGGAVIALSQGDTTSTMLALAAADGRVLWQRQVPQNNAGGEPLVTSAAVCISVTAADGSGAVLALSPADGTVLWQYTTRDDVRGFDGLANGALFAYTDDPHSGVPTLVALDAVTGQMLWTYTPPQDSSTPPSGYAGPVIAGSTMYLTTNAVSNGQVTAGMVIALDAATGKQLWRSSAAGDNFSNPPVVVDGVVYVLGSGALYALRATDGHLLWRTSGVATLGGGQQNIATPLVADGGVYLASGDGRITALRASDGSQMWQRHINASAFALFEESGRLDVVTQLNSVYALSTDDGHLLWQRSTGIYNTWDAGAPPVAVAGGVIYTGTNHGVIQAIRTGDGNELWRYAIPPKAVPPEPVYSAFVTFDASLPYETELHALADLGLQPIQLCVWKNWPWHAPVYSDAGFTVAATPSSPAGWLRQLGKLPGVVSAQSNPRAWCLLMGDNTQPPGTATYLPPEQTGIVARIRFAATTPYGAALDTITTLGFRLADPCYERQPKGAPVAWHPMGQEQSYAATHALIVMTTDQSSTQWERQAQTSAGVAGVDVNPALSC